MLHVESCTVSVFVIPNILKNLSSQCIGIHMIYLHIKFHFPGRNALLIVAIKLKITYTYRMDDISDNYTVLMWILSMTGN
jgi:hypothetical protein